MAQWESFPLPKLEELKGQLLGFARGFDQFLFLDSNQSDDPYGKFQCLLALGSHQEIRIDQAADLEELKNAVQVIEKANTQHWFGYWSYDLKEAILEVPSQNPKSISWPQLCFFQAEILIRVRGNKLEIKSEKENAIDILERLKVAKINAWQPKPLKFQASTNKTKYIQDIESIKSQIRKGDFYEINLCQEFKATGNIDALSFFDHLNKTEAAPFSGLLKLSSQYLLCFSPERYLQKMGNKLVSQPIKGTASRFANRAKDALSKKQLAESVKEQAENVMIVDLVRNDLSKSGKPGSVRVPELFGIYPFQQVWQMISTITAELLPQRSKLDPIFDSFPMGSMTGAPKLEVIKNIEKYEAFARGIYSGALGYFDDNGDFDFNVVIRSLEYCESTKQLSLKVGGAITYDSDPEAEYNETLLKARAILQEFAEK